MTTRRDKERRRRRELLLEAAERVFARKPFDEATMQEVAAEAEIGMQGLYEHFPSKQDLYEQVMQARAEAFHTRADEVLAARGGTALDRMEALALVYAQDFEGRPFALPSFVRDRVQFDWGIESRFRTRLEEIYQAERSRLKALVEEALAEGLLRPLDPDFLTQLAMDVLQASLHHAHRQTPREPASACVARAMNCLLRGVGGISG
ncbi:MAG TPA: TetR/AcrR family transcriptional regulator [Holophaga sp.]|nr:TetR/AcrR family transcriptional regulator [Holophaga sp.]